MSDNDNLFSGDDKWPSEDEFDDNSTYALPIPEYIRTQSMHCSNQQEYFDAQEWYECIQRYNQLDEEEKEGYTSEEYVSESENV